MIILILILIILIHFYQEIIQIERIFISRINYNFEEQLFLLTFIGIEIIRIEVIFISRKNLFFSFRDFHPYLSIYFL